MSADAERRSRLLSLKLRALVREHLGLTSDPQGTPEVFSPGAAFLTDEDVWVLIDGDATRSLGATLAWATRLERPIQLLVERDSGVVARRAQFFSASLTVWHVDEKTLLPAVPEPHLPAVEPAASHVALMPLISSSGADAVVEHGIVVGEVRGLEMCRVVDDATTGEARLEVGMGVNDREAFAMVHGEMPTEQALRTVIDAVAIHREPGAMVHPFNQFGAERLHRWRALQNPQSVGFAFLQPANPPVKRTNLKDPVPCVAVGKTIDGQNAVAVFVNGVDLDVVPFAVDAADLHNVERSVVVARDQDVTPSLRRTADLSTVAVSFVSITNN
ncbi:MAG: hypothetical protein LW600_00200 [Ilumatobacteraceae bacterium]|nr:hypothetical protein [Ilumatobacteraceae bacterium]